MSGSFQLLARAEEPCPVRFGGCLRVRITLKMVRYVAVYLGGLRGDLSVYF